jgi:Arylsulfotransferase (ASST)/Domain of unknown function (DUF4214)
VPYLLGNGELLHTGNVGNTSFDAGGAGGIVQTIDWDGNVTWEYNYSSTSYLQHHDVEMLANGNILMIVWQYKSNAEAIAAGRKPSNLTDGELWPDSVIEVKPTGSNTGQIVWEWHIWDHLVQDYDSTKSNYGVVADHPELIDINYVINPGADWNHINAVDYNADLDQIVLSVHNFSEIWVIDHSTTTVEAASHSGGNNGIGGDLLYRWGNPQAYGAGTATDQLLFVQHDAEWIENGDPGEGNIIIFNNGGGRPEGDYSSIEEISPPVNLDGSYTLVAGSSYGPDKSSWTYTAKNPGDFYAKNISGQQRLPNGNTLICDGPSAHFFEVTETGETVWDYYYTGSVFRVERYAPDYSGFDGTPLDSSSTNAITQTEISQLYVTLFGRASEGDGNDYWQFNANSTSMTAVANVMLETEAAKTYFGTTLDNNQEFIEHIYLNNLNKTFSEDQSGINYWTGELNNGKTKGEVVSALIVAAQSPENMGSAQDQFNNKVEVSNYCADKIAVYTDYDTFKAFIANVTDDNSVTAAKAEVDAY